MFNDDNELRHPAFHDEFITKQKKRWIMIMFWIVVMLGLVAWVLFCIWIDYFK